MTDGSKEHRLGLAGLLGGVRHLLQRLLHAHARRDVDQHANRYVLVAVARMHKADLQVSVTAGQHIDKINLLAADDFVQPQAIFLRQQRQIVMRQFITEDVGAIAGT